MPPRVPYGRGRSHQRRTVQARSHRPRGGRSRWQPGGGATAQRTRRSVALSAGRTARQRLRRKTPTRAGMPGMEQNADHPRPRYPSRAFRPGACDLGLRRTVEVVLTGCAVPGGRCSTSAAASPSLPGGGPVGARRRKSQSTGPAGRNKILDIHGPAIHPARSVRARVISTCTVRSSSPAPRPPGGCSTSAAASPSLPGGMVRQAEDLSRPGLRPPPPEVRPPVRRTSPQVNGVAGPPMPCRLSKRRPPHRPRLRSATPGLGPRNPQEARCGPGPTTTCESGHSPPARGG
jgi:hypothetical protein